mgnify:CR=1 FL=1
MKAKMSNEVKAGKHTSGPWRIMNSHKAGFVNIYTTHDAGIEEAADFICEIGPAARQPGTEAEANARIIAASPSLCAVLVEIVKQFDADPDGRIGVAIVNDARLAITKATGGE